SSIYSIGANTPTALLVATVKAGVLTYRQAAHWLEFRLPADRAQALGWLVPHLSAELKAEGLAEALAAARLIEAPSARVWPLGVLVPHLSAALRAEVLAEALAVARLIEDPSERAQALGRLVPQWSGEILQQECEELLDMLPRCQRYWSLFAVSS